jgi:hypothetical protein
MTVDYFYKNYNPKVNIRKWMSFEREQSDHSFSPNQTKWKKISDIILNKDGKIMEGFHALDREKLVMNVRNKIRVYHLSYFQHNRKNHSKFIGRMSKNRSIK